MHFRLVHHRRVPQWQSAEITGSGELCRLDGHYQIVVTIEQRIAPIFFVAAGDDSELAVLWQIQMGFELIPFRP